MAYLQKTSMAAVTRRELDPKPRSEAPEDAEANAEREEMFRKKQKRRQANLRLRRSDAPYRVAPSKDQDRISRPNAYRTETAAGGVAIDGG